MSCARVYWKAKFNLEALRGGHAIGDGQHWQNRLAKRCSNDCVEYDEPTMELLAERGVWLSLQPFLEDEDAIPTTPGSINKIKYRMVAQCGTRPTSAGQRSMSAIKADVTGRQASLNTDNSGNGNSGDDDTGSNGGDGNSGDGNNMPRQASARARRTASLALRQSRSKAAAWFPPLLGNTDSDGKDSFCGDKEATAGRPYAPKTPLCLPQEGKQPVPPRQQFLRRGYLGTSAPPLTR
jgi:hypothetical protein